MKTPAIACLAIIAFCAACADHSASPTSPASATSAVTAASNAGGHNVDTPVITDLGTGGQIYGDGAPFDSIIQTSNTCCHDWLLNTTPRVTIDFSGLANNPFGAPTLTPSDTGMISQCHLVYPSAFPGMVPNVNYSCPFIVTFHSSDTIGDGAKTPWKVVMGGGVYANLSTTGIATVTCQAQNGPGGTCSQWTLNAVSQMAALVKVSTKGFQPDTIIGYLPVSFSFAVRE